VAFCSACGTQIPDGSTTCPAFSIRSTAISAGTSHSRIRDVTVNVSVMLTYVTHIHSIVFTVYATY